MSIREPYEQVDHAGIRFPFKSLEYCGPLMAGGTWVGDLRIRAVASATLVGRYA
jgi:hypothetical protein